MPAMAHTTNYEAQHSFYCQLVKVMHRDIDANTDLLINDNERHGKGFYEVIDCKIPIPCDTIGISLHQTNECLGDNSPRYQRGVEGQMG